MFAIYGYKWRYTCQQIAAWRRVSQFGHGCKLLWFYSLLVDRNMRGSLVSADLAMTISFYG